VLCQFYRFAVNQAGKVGDYIRTEGEGGVEKGEGGGGGND